MATGITPYINVLLVGVPILGALYAAPLMLARRWWGRIGLWIAAILCSACAGWAVVEQDSTVLRDSADNLAFGASLLLTCALVSAYLVDRASIRSPMPPVWRRVAYAIGGIYIGAVLVFVGAMLVLVATLLMTRLT